MPIAAHMQQTLPWTDEVETNPPLSQPPGQRRPDPRVVPERPVDELLHLVRHQAQVLEGRRIQVQKNLKRKSFKNEEALRRGSPVDRAAFKRPGSVLLFWRGFKSLLRHKVVRKKILAAPSNNNPHIHVCRLGMPQKMKRSAWLRGSNASKALLLFITSRPGFESWSRYVVFERQWSKKCNKKNLNLVLRGMVTPRESIATSKCAVLGSNLGGTATQLMYCDWG